jgi:hypothetical protein
MLSTFISKLVGLPSIDKPTDVALGGPRDLAFLAAAGVLLSGVVALPTALAGRLLFDKSSACEHHLSFGIFKGFGMLVVAPVIESMILGGLVLLMARFGRWQAVAFSAAFAALLHAYINGPLSLVVVLPFLVFARVFQIGQLLSEFSIGVRRAAVCHAGYNAPIFAAASLCLK